MNKKIYVKPLIEIKEVESTEMICTSGEGQPDPTGAGFQDLEDGEFEW